MLMDESANGTFVRFEGKNELHLRREETVLVGHGYIGLGQTTLLDETNTVAFAVQ